jgi:hypothetical protein
MKRILIAILAAGLAVVLFAPTADAASSARKKSRDTPGCVTKAEYNSVTRGMTLAQVQGIFDTAGRTSSTIDQSYWADGEWVDNGHYTGAWVDGWYTGEWVPGYYNHHGWVDGYWDEYGGDYYEGYWDEYGGEWVDNSYWTEGSYVSAVDYFRDYKKCKSFQRGKGRVAINFDTYTSPYSGARVYSKAPKRPAIWNAYGLRTSANSNLLAGKHVPKAKHAHKSSP